MAMLFHKHKNGEGEQQYPVRSPVASKHLWRKGVKMLKVSDRVNIKQLALLSLALSSLKIIDYLPIMLFHILLCPKLCSMLLRTYYARNSNSIFLYLLFFFPNHIGSIMGGLESIIGRKLEHKSIA